MHSIDFSDLENPERREFTVQALLALLAGTAITITGCGDDTPASPSPNPGSSDVIGTVAANHGHSAVITSAQLIGAGAVTLNIRGSATHPHTVELTASEVQRIGARQQVAKESTTDDGHRHLVTFN